MSNSSASTPPAVPFLDLHATYIVSKHAPTVAYRICDRYA